MKTELLGGPCLPARRPWAACHPPARPPGLGVWLRWPGARWLPVQSVLPGVPLASRTSRFVRGAAREGEAGENQMQVGPPPCRQHKHGLSASSAFFQPALHSRSPGPEEDG